MESLGVEIIGTGHALPENCVSSGEIDARLGLTDGHLAQISGVLTRYVCGAEDQIDLATEAAGQALTHAGIEGAEIDLVIGACAIPYQPLPATAPLVMARLGLRDGAAAAFDVNASCLSFVNAFELAAARIALGQSRVALVVSSEVASRALPWKDQPDVAALFGDGAAAVVLRAPNRKGPTLHASLSRCYPTYYDACRIGSGGTRIDYHNAPEQFAEHAVFRMEGRQLFRATRKHFPGFIRDLLDKVGWQAGDIDAVVPHQASPQALAHMAAHSGLHRDRIIDITRSHGNQIAASIPTALDIGMRDGRIGSGARVLVLGTSAGISLGGLALEI